MKKIIILALAMFISLSATAGLPFISLGLKAGINTEKQHLSYSGTDIENIANIADAINKATTGYHFGIVMRLDLPVLPIFIQPELNYSFSRTKTNISTVGNLTHGNFNVPVLFGVGFGSAKMLKLRANFGPVFNLISTVTTNGDNFHSHTFIEPLEKNTVTWTAGVGIDLLGIMFDVRYNGAFKKTKVNAITTCPSSWSFSLGYLF